MSIQHVFIISKAGSLIYSWENKANESISVDKTYQYPLDIKLDIIDQKPTVVFGECEKIKLRYIVTSINNKAIVNGKFNDNDEEKDLMEYLEDKKNYPLTLTFNSPQLTANEKIILSSMFHSLYTIAAQVAPTPKSYGIECLETTQFKLHCFQSLTGVKFIAVVSDSFTQSVDGLLKKVYEIYADFALKDPFYAIDMPIRCEKFDEALNNTLEKYESTSAVTV
uniref:Trafficking protein particle complex subunit n=1 Tax=Parastrongyloides trichosuri TaxID=131310 RepID=A0A0N4ZE51_PARTI